jgi:hypothetical protein
MNRRIGDIVSPYPIRRSRTPIASRTKVPRTTTSWRPWTRGRSGTNALHAEYKIDELPEAGRGQFRSGREADDAEEQTEALEQFADDYTDYCDQLHDVLDLACQYFTLHAESLGRGLQERMDRAYRSIATMEVGLEDMIGTLELLVEDVQRATAIDSDTLLAEKKARPARAEARVHEYFKLGRLQIGPNRSFYASGYDADPGAFGGEWALVTDDPSLADVAKQWVYHTHCEGDGDKSTRDYKGFKIKRGHGASHIKRIADRMVGGVSITVDYPPEFNRIEQRDRGRFLDWLDRWEGSDAIKNQNPRTRGNPDGHLWQNAPYLREAAAWDRED